MKLTKSINVQGTIVPAGTELHFSNEGIGYYNGIEVRRDMFPEVAIEAALEYKLVSGYKRRGHCALLGIYVYDSTIKTICGLKTPPKPWLHAAIITESGSGHTFVAIYVWDTRRVVAHEQSKLSSSDIAKLNDISQAVDNRRTIKLPKPTDDYYSNGIVDLTNSLLEDNNGKTLADMLKAEDKQA